MGTAVGTRPAASPWLRRTGSGAFVGPDRAFPHLERPGQHASGPTDDGGPVLPSSAVPGAWGGTSAARRLHPQVAFAGPAVSVAPTRAGHRNLPDRGRRP